MKKVHIVYLVLFAFAFLIPSLASAATFSRNLSYGTVGTEVSQLQQFLSDEGLFTAKVNATFGSMTKAAVVAFQKQEGIVPANGYFGPLTRADANTVITAHPEWTTTLSTSTTYNNVNGNTVHSPSYSSSGNPAGATAQCGDGTYSFSLHHSGSCSHHGGVSSWL
jgi:peptidoglycan hydrolase-like protein with peptidoglycan-binding domain